MKLLISDVRRRLEGLNPYRWYIISPTVEQLVSLKELVNNDYMEIRPAHEHPIGMKFLYRMTGRGRMAAGFIKSWVRACDKCGKNYKAIWYADTWCDKCIGGNDD